MQLAAEREAGGGFAPLATLARLDRARRGGKAAAAAVALAAALADAPDNDDLELAPGGDGVRVRGTEEGPTAAAVAAALARAVVLTGFDPPSDAHDAALSLLSPIAPPESVVALTDADAARRLPPGSAVGLFLGNADESDAPADAYTCAVAVLADETAVAAAVAALDRAGGWRARGAVRVRRAFVPKAFRPGAAAKLPKQTSDVEGEGGEAADGEPADDAASTAPPSRSKAKRRTKKDYAAWAGATMASRAEAVAALAGDGEGGCGEEGGATAAPPPPPPPRAGPRQPAQGERGFGAGRGRPL